MTTPQIDPEISSLLAQSDNLIFDAHEVFSTTKHFETLRTIGAVPQDARVDVEDRFTEAGLRLRVYRPTGTTEGDAKPLILMFHSGGYVHSRPETEEGRALRYAADVDAVVVSVDWSHAPEHPYPAAADESYAALLWSVANAQELGADASRLAVAGCSAGGTFAASTALRARDLGGPAIQFQLLIYAGLDDRQQTESVRTLNDIPVLTGDAMRHIWGYYRPDGADDGYAAPARARDLTGLPPTMIMAAEVDPLRDENVGYGLRLSAAGVSTEIVQVPGAIHGFELLFPDTVIARRALDTQVRALRDGLHSQPA